MVVEDSRVLEIERLLGRCVLRAQQWELLAKGMISDHHVEGPLTPAGGLQSFKTADNDTMGGLVTALFDLVVVPYSRFVDGVSPSVLEGVPADAPPRVAYYAAIQLSPVDWQELEARHREMVVTRNFLVHTLTQGLDLSSTDAVSELTQRLHGALVLIDANYRLLRQWAEMFDEGRERHVQFLRSADGQAFLSPE